jgi:hypothetical protein
MIVSIDFAVDKNVFQDLLQLFIMKQFNVIKDVKMRPRKDLENGHL